MSPIRILLVDDHPVVRKGIAAMLETVNDMEVAGEAGDGLQAVDMAVQLKPDVILMDLVMPRMDGVEAIRQILARDPNARILVLTSFASDDKVLASINAGATGYLLKDSDPDDLVRAIQQVHRGESSLHPAVARILLNELNKPAQHETKQVDELTDRELEVLSFIAKGLSNQEIAEKLVISRATVHSHVSKILAKLNLDSRTQAALFAIKEGYVIVDPQKK